MGRTLSIPVLGLSAALTASIIPHFLDLLVDLLNSVSPVLANTRGQVNLVMLFVICWSARADLAGSLIWGFVGGLALDLLSILPIGTTSAALIVMAFVINSVASQVFRVRLIFLVAATPLATVLLTTYTLLALGLLGNGYDVIAVTRLVLIPTVFWNCLAVIPVYSLVRLMQRRLEGGLLIAPQSLNQGSDSRSAE